MNTRISLLPASDAILWIVGRSVGRAITTRMHSCHPRKRTSVWRSPGSWAIIVLAAILCTASSALGQQSKEHPNPATANANPRKHPVLVLEGTAYERGLKHGSLMRSPINELVRLWQKDLESAYKLPADDFIKRFVETTDYVTSMKKWTPDLLDEIKGIAEGAGIGFETMFVFQFADECWAQGDGIARERCSSIGFSQATGVPSCVAQNNDLEAFRDGFQVVLRIKYPGSDLQVLVHSNAGGIGWNGLNNKRIGIVVNTLSQLSNRREGLPVNCIVRGVLAQRTEADATAFFDKVKHASGANYIVGGPDRVHCFECSATKVVRYQPNDKGKAVWHTNHPLANQDYNPKYKAGDEDIDSNVRLHCLDQRLRVDSSGPRIELVKQTLASKDSAKHPICRTKAATMSGFFTFASSIMVLSDPPEFLVSFGPPDDAGYERLSF